MIILSISLILKDYLYGIICTIPGRGFFVIILTLLHHTAMPFPGQFFTNTLIKDK